MLTGENGILTQAQNSKEAMRAASIQEAIDLWNTSKKLDKHAGTETAMTRTEFLEDLKGQGLITEEEYTKLEEGETITIGSKQITLGKQAKTLVQAFIDGDLEIGDYVNYQPIAGKTTSVEKAETGYDGIQSYTVRENETNWQVLGLSEDEEHLLLTSSEPIQADGDNKTLILQAAEGHVMGERTLNKICNIYKNEFADEARSMKIEDVNNLIGITVDSETKTVYKTSDETKTNIGTEGALGLTYQYIEGDYVPENYMRDKYLNDENVSAEVKKYIEENVKAKKIGDTSISNMYSYNLSEELIADVSGKIIDMLFYKVIVEEEEMEIFVNWLGSHKVFEDSEEDTKFGIGMAFFEDNLIGNDSGLMAGYKGHWIGIGLGVRPVISLGSEVTVNDIQEITEEEINAGVIWGDNIISGQSMGILDGTEGKLVSE